ncbi:MAG: 3-deoxy-8-phosphooctulonate synthase [Deltaproteobacteria bacterium]|nr:3-deoxy-8-phosphooctulonate synthase [Deltaproteobacteria bacterium]
MVAPGITVGAGRPLALIAGPCVLEDDATVFMTADRLVRLAARHEVPLIFKSSFEKDNRTRGDAFRGPGLAEGLALFEALHARFDMPILTDVHREEDVPAVAAVVDVLQVPAFLCRQTRLLEAIGRTGKPVNVKKGQWLSPVAMAGTRDKLRSSGTRRILLTERGSAFGPERLVCDMSSIATLRGLGCPAVFDAGHASNRREEIPILARAGVAAGADALFVEVHPDPQRARCDGPRMLDLDELEALLPLILEIAAIVRSPL